MGMLVNHNKKWGYLHIPKTGGTSIEKAYYVLDSTTKWLTQYGTLNEFGNVKNYFLFTFVRNPYTRFGSMYYSEKKRGRFDKQNEFIERIKRGMDLPYYPQSYFIKKGSSDTKKINFIGKTENIVGDINKVNDVIGYRKISTLPTENKNPILERHSKLKELDFYKSLLDDESIKFVREYYKEDFERFGYELDI